MSLQANFIFCMQTHKAASSGLGLDQIGISFASCNQQFCEALEQGNFQRCVHFIEHGLIDEQYVIDLFKEKLIEMFDIDICKAMIEHGIVDIKKVDIDAVYKELCASGEYCKCRVMVNAGLVDFNARIEIFRKHFKQLNMANAKICAQMAKEMVFVGRVYKILDYFDVRNYFLEKNFDCTLLKDIFEYAVAFEDKDLYKALHKAGLTERYQINNAIFLKYFECNDFESCKFMLNVDDTLCFEPLFFFTKALEQNDEKKCRIVIDQKLISDDQIVAVFFEQAKAGDFKKVSFLLEKGIVPVDVAKRNASGKMVRPIHYAAHKGHLNIVALLIKHGACVNIVHQDEACSPLAAAASGGNLSVVNYLLEAGALPENNLLVRVCYKDEDFEQKTTKLPLYKRLLEIGADINAVNPDNGKTVVHKVASADPEAYKYLSTIPIYDATIRDFYGQTAAEIFEASERVISHRHC